MQQSNLVNPIFNIFYVNTLTENCIWWVTLLLYSHCNSAFFYLKLHFSTESILYPNTITLSERTLNFVRNALTAFVSRALCGWNKIQYCKIEFKYIIQYTNKQLETFWVLQRYKIVRVLIFFYCNCTFLLTLKLTNSCNSRVRSIKASSVISWSDHIITAYLQARSYKSNNKVDQLLLHRDSPGREARVKVIPFLDMNAKIEDKTKYILVK